MTDRLATLLHAEALDVPVPTPPTGAILHEGRRLRRRRRLVVGAGAAAACLAVVAAGAAGLRALPGGDGAAPDRRVVDPATSAYRASGAFATGSVVHLGDGSHVDLGEAVKALYYTSAGVVARTGETPWTDDPGPSRYSLVAPDGTVSGLGIDLGDRVPATDPDQALLAWAERAAGATADGAWQVVVLDVVSGREVARVDVEGRFSWGGWEAPPVTVDGDTVYVGLDRAVVAVDWAAGTTRVTDLAGGRVPPTSGGHLMESDTRVVRVVDVETGATVYEVPNEGFPYVALSPDGRFAKVVHQDEQEAEGFEVVDLTDGSISSVEGAAWDYGWTPEGNLISISRDRDELRTCVADTGECTSAPVTGATRGELKLAGLSYES